MFTKQTYWRKYVYLDITLLQIWAYYMVRKEKIFKKLIVFFSLSDLNFLFIYLIWFDLFHNKNMHITDWKIYRVDLYSQLKNK